MMKILFLLSTLIFSMSAFADNNNCNEVKTAYHIYKAQDAIVDMASCKTPICLIRKSKSTEKHFCKAVNACEPIAIQFKYPCTEDDKLTDEAKENAKRIMVESVEKVIEYIKSLGRDKTGNEGGNTDTDSDDILSK